MSNRSWDDRGRVSQSIGFRPYSLGHAAFLYPVAGVVPVFVIDSCLGVVDVMGSENRGPIQSWRSLTVIEGWKLGQSRAHLVPRPEGASSLDVNGCGIMCRPASCAMRRCAAATAFSGSAVPSPTATATGKPNKPLP